LLFQHGQVFLDHSPCNLDIHAKVFVSDNGSGVQNHNVSHVADSPPINLRVIGFDFSWHLSARFADHLEIPEDGVECLSIARNLRKSLYRL